MKPAYAARNRFPPRVQEPHVAQADALPTSLDTAAAAAEKAKLRKVLGRLDLVLFTACAILGFDTVAASAEAGAQAITWLLISLVIFLVPYGMLTAELGSAFAVEGGPYEWARLAFGRCAGSVTAILYWLSNPTWIGGTLTAATIAALDTLVLHKPLGTTAEIIVGLAFVWVTVAIAIVAFRIGKWGPNLGTIVKIAVTLLFTVMFIAFLVQHGRPVGASSAADLKPSLSGFLTVIGLLVFLWVGFELSNGAAEEMVNPQRDVPKMILRSGIICAVIYGALIVGIILVIPKSGLSNVSGFADAYNAVSGVFHSHGLNVLFAILLIVTLIASGAVWLEGADRTQAIASLDGAGPRWMGRFTSFGTPIAVNLASGVVSSGFVLFVFLATSGKLENFFAVMLSLTVSTTAVSYVFIFPALVRLRVKYPDRPRPYRVPFGMAGAWAAAIITEAFVVVTAVTLLWPGAINNLFGQSYSMESSWGVSRPFFEWVTLGAFGVMVLLGIAFWAIGARNVRRGLLTRDAVGQETP
jgi:amino acid transporter